MNDNQANTKRIAKNTILLYFRMIFTMAVSLYSSRVILRILGVEDYGIYNVVGGVVSMLSYLTATLSGASSRFITIELGRGNLDNLRKIFRSSCTIYYILSIAVFVLAETIGLWFVMTQLTIPDERMFAAFWVYQFSVLTFIISLLTTSYNALVIAHERMNAFAYVSIYDAVMKLLILFLLAVIPLDHLILYAFLYMLVQLSVCAFYIRYCVKHFNEVSSKWLWDSSISRQIFTYAGWTMNGYLAVAGYTQGLNILLNIYFGPVVNAARAVAVQVQAALNHFYNNFQMAVRPQIMKSYAQGNFEYMHPLVLKTARLSFLLAMLVSVPVFTYADYIIGLWLTEVPEHTIAFVRLTIIAGASGAMSQHTNISIHATGDIRRFQLIEGTGLLLIVPLAWIGLKYFSISPEAVISIYVLIECLMLFVRVWLVYPKINLPIRKFFVHILKPSLLTLVGVGILAWLLQYYLPAADFTSFLLSASFLVIGEIGLIFTLGLESDEKKMLLSKCKMLVNKKRN